VVVDGIGEHITALLGHWDGRRMEVLRRYRFPDSLGFLWEKLSTFLGFGEYDACKVMGLAAYGNASVYKTRLSKLVTTGDDGFAVDPDVVRFRAGDVDAVAQVLGQPEALTERQRADIAAALQSTTDTIMLHLVRQVHDWMPSPDLCLAGGVALNCATNYRLSAESPYRRIFVPSAPHDAGTALGAALAFDGGADAQVDPDPIGRASQASRLRDPYLGPSFDEADFLSCMRLRGLSGERCEDPAGTAADLLSRGAIVAWFQGRMEFGPRALGNRSLLADPRDPLIREVLNAKVKHREPFRPFAPSVLAERAREWFLLPGEPDSYAYMSFACPVRPECRERIPAVVHEDGTARLQVVTRQANPLFHDLIAAFERRTGVPLVLNTSFNDSEPIVCSPDDAINTFLATRIDALVLGPYLVRRS
jgi:carbamoyltransferase